MERMFAHDCTSKHFGKFSIGALFLRRFKVRYFCADSRQIENARAIVISRVSDCIVNS